MITSRLYQHLGRTPPRAGVVSALPPSMRLYEAEYTRHLRAFWTLWSAKVRAEAERVAGRRTDASAGDWDRLLAESGIGDYLRSLHGKIANKNAAYVERVTKIPLRASASQGLEEQFVQRNLGLIKGLGQDHTEQLAEVFRTAAASGQRHEELIPLVQERLGVGFSRAKLIARDQVSKLSGQLQEAQQTAAGVEEYEWSTAGDEAVRPDHKALNGRRFRWDSPPVVNQKTGERRHPGGDIQCRCAPKPVISLFDGI